MSVAVHRWGTAPEFVGPRHELRERLLLQVLLEGAPGRRVVDVGAGSGTFAHRLERLGFDVTAVDASAETIRRLAGMGVKAVLADAVRLPFEDASFEAAVAAEVLEHIADDVAALTEIARVVRPGGVVAVSVPSGRTGASDRWAGHERRYSRDSLLEACGRAGLSVERCSAWGFPASSLYHRLVYERYLARHGPAPASGWKRIPLAFVAACLKVDRLFVGVETGSLGYLVRARRP